MDKKFEIGDRVRSKFYGVVGTITEVDTDGYILKPDTDDDMWIADTDVEPYDPKTAFLSELKGLLEKYDASIYVIFNRSDEIYTTTIAVGEDSVKYNYTDGIDSDNIMDYGKE